MTCLPNPIKLPAIQNLSSPEEVNSLERQETGRAIDNKHSKRQNNLEDTIKEVQDILKSDPTLPRLTRGEIIDLLENVTNKDERVQIFGGDGENRDPKSIMVVMPFTPLNTDDKSMEDLYTKAPITEIIAGESRVNTTKQFRRPTVKYSDTTTDNDLAKKPIPNDEKKKYSTNYNNKEKPTVAPRGSHRRRRPQVTTEIVTTYHPPIEASSTVKTSRRPVTRRRTTTTTNKHPNHRYPDEELTTISNGFLSSGIKIIDSPNLTIPEDVQIITLPDLDQQIKEDFSSTTSTTARTTTFPRRRRTRPTKTTTTSTTTPTTLIEDINLPENFKGLVKDLNLESAINPKPTPFKPRNPSIEEQNHIKNMLASIGVLPLSTTTTTTTAIPNAENVAESLSPEMRDLLMSFGLLPNPDTKPNSSGPGYNPEKAEMKAESYVGFKPLPDDSPSRDDMETLLASFGLTRTGRNQKVKAKPDEINLDVVPDHLKGVLLDLGFGQSNREEKKIRGVAPLEKTVEKQHVFNPDLQYATQDELKKLEKLIGVIKQLEKMNGTATEEDLRKIDLQSLKELIGSFNGYKNEGFLTLDQKELYGPDPTKFDKGLVKNEVKRQESSTSSTPTSSATISTVSTSTEARSPSLADLEASFGGQTETSSALPETTTAKRTGFYYLVDWNTFLDIDDTKGKAVNLRFQPKIGDPKRFLSVTVP